MVPPDTPPPGGLPLRSEPGEAPLLSVVVGSVESERTIAACLDALSVALRPFESEVILVDASRDRTRQIVAREFPRVLLRTRPPGTLVPALWAEGVGLSRGRYVAVTTGHCLAPPGWAAALLAALAGGAAGAGAGLLPARGLSRVDRAVFYLRYAGFLPLTEGEAHNVSDLPGENAVYDGGALRAFVAERGAEGFWEVEFHRALRAAGRPLVAVPGASVGFGPSFPFGVIARHRFAHGRHYGRWKVRVLGRRGAGALLGTPAIPALFLARALRMVRGRRGHPGGLLGAVVPFLLLAGAWAAGEATGAAQALWRERTRAPERTAPLPRST